MCKGCKGLKPTNGNFFESTILKNRSIYKENIYTLHIMMLSVHQYF